jgi:hypothetical protein
MIPACTPLVAVIGAFDHAPPLTDHQTAQNHAL